MSDIDLSAAVEAAARARYEESIKPWDQMSARDARPYFGVVRNAVEAAAPVIEAQVREQIAKDIESATRRNTSSLGAESALYLAADIARGVTS